MMTRPQTRDSAWFFKNVEPPGYSVYKGNGGCTGLNDYIGTHSLQECANMCSMDSACVSIEYLVSQNRCHLSNDCVYEMTLQADNNAWDFYQKNVDDEDEDECPILPFAQAKVSSSLHYFLTVH